MRTNIMYGILWTFLTFTRNKAEHVLDTINSTIFEKMQNDMLDNINNFKTDLHQTIPGEPDIDYPIYSSVPNTTFLCRERHEGYYSDIESRCQAFRICTHTAKTPQGFGVLCPNGTLFSQKFLVCDWYRNVNCSESEFYYSNNVFDVGNDYEMMKTIRHMIEYPILMLKQKNSQSSSTKLEELKINNSTIYEIHEHKNNVYVNNLGELTTEVDESSFINNIYEPQYLDGDDLKTYNFSTLASKINNLMESDVISNIKLNASDYKREQTYRFISHGFSTPNDLLFANNKSTEWPYLHEMPFKPINHLSNNNEEYISNNKTVDMEAINNYSNKDNKNETSTILKKKNESDMIVLSQKGIEVRTATETTNLLFGNTNIQPNVSEPKNHAEYVPKYATNLLLAGIKQSDAKTFTQLSNKHNLEKAFHIEADTYNKDVKNNNNTLNRGNSQIQKSAKIDKPFVSTTKMSSLYAKRITANKLRLSRISYSNPKTVPTTDVMPAFNKSAHSSIEKRISIRNINKNDSFIHNLSLNYKKKSINQPNYDGVYKSLQHYRIIKNDLLHNSKLMTTPNSNKQKFSLVNNSENIPHKVKNITNSNGPSSKRNLISSILPITKYLSFETKDPYAVINSSFTNTTNKYLINSSTSQNEDGKSPMANLFHHQEDTLMGFASQFGHQNITTTSSTKENVSPVVIAQAEGQRYDPNLFLGIFKPHTYNNSSKYISLEDFFAKKFGRNVNYVTQSTLSYDIQKQQDKIN